MPWPLLDVNLEILVSAKLVNERKVEVREALDDLFDGVLLRLDGFFVHG